MNKIMKSKKSYKISVIGLGYVGLPLAVEFSKKFETIGFDINNKRIQELKNGNDSTLEVGESELNKVLKLKKYGLSLTNISSDIKNSNVYIITVPTPIDKNKRPDLRPIESASKLVSNFIKKGDIVIFESTVYPGLTEEFCVPILENNPDKLLFNKDFFVGYSPERINPGDKERTLTKIVKVTSGSNKLIAEEVNELYSQIIKAGTFMASSIKVAEAAKVIENSQRDINIAFVNELSKIFNLLGINTNDVLKAASTKWNFLNFKPGLVGGHCIGVDPYYLSQKAQEIGYYPEIILAGRRLNDSMSLFVVNEVIKLMLNKSINVKNASVLILGVSFKENCPDFRNTKVIDIIEELIEFKAKVTAVDPWVNAVDFHNEYGIKIFNEIPKLNFDCIILAVPHHQFLDLNLKTLLNENGILYDIKGLRGKEADGGL